MSTLKEIKELTKTDKYMALCLATEHQCERLIACGAWDEDDCSRQQDAHEELRVMTAALKDEFGG